MKKAIGLSSAFIGTVIGAGFATGREISLFFSSCSLFSVIAAGFFLGFFCYIILRISSRSGNIFSAFGFLKVPLKIFAFVANFCVLCATLAGSENVLHNLFSFDGGAIITAIFCLIVVLFGIKYVKNLNVVVVPVILILYSYASMNLITGGFLIGSDADSVSKKEAFICASISGIVLTLLLVCVYSVVKNVSAEMPFIEKADSLGLGIVGNVILDLAMLTTVVGTLSVCSVNNKLAAFLVISVALLLSSFGFGFLVDTVYPVIGALGSAVTACSLLIFVLLNPKFSRSYILLFRPDGSLLPRRWKRVN